MVHETAIRAYYRCFAARDRAGLERLLLATFRHISAFGVYEDRDRMLDEIWPNVGRTWAIDIQVFGTTSEFMVRYRHAGERSGSMAEYFRFDGDKIAEVEVFTGRS